MHGKISDFSSECLNLFVIFKYRILSISSISSWAVRRPLCIVQVKFSQRNSEEVLVVAQADKIISDGRKNTSTHILLENYKLWNDWCWADASLPASDRKI